MEKALEDRALRAYARAVGAIEPLRLRFWEERGLTMPQLQLMFALIREGGQPVGQLAERLRVRPATVTGLTDRLYKAGLITREADPSDRRVVRIELSKEGEQILRDMTSESRVYLSDVLNRMSPERIELMAELLEEFQGHAHQVTAASEAPAK